MSQTKSTKATKTATPQSKAARPTARERIQQAHLQEQRALRRRRTVVIGASIAAALALVGATAVAIATAGDSSSDTAVVVPANASGPDGTVIVYGRADAPHTLQVFEDFRCPVCKTFEAVNGETVKKLVDEGSIKVEYRLAAFLDRNLGGKGSRTALAAAGAALNEGVDKFKQFHDVLYANQPEESEDGFGDVNHILDLAGQVPGLKSDAFVKAVTERTYAPWAGRVAAAFDDSGVSGTPTVKVDGKTVPIFEGRTPVSPEKFTALVKQAAGL